MRGIGVAIPLSIVQTAFQSMHLNAITPVGLPDVALNVALAHAIYGKDRLAEDDRVGRLTTTACLYGAITYYATDLWTLPLAPLAGYLHYEYKESKPSIATVKPIVVGVCWTAATYFQPLLLRHDPAVWNDVGHSLSLTAAMTAISHYADISDIKEDEADGIMTPAVLLGPDAAKDTAAFALLLAWLVHQGIPMYNVYDFIYDGALFVGALSVPTAFVPRATIGLVSALAMANSFNPEFSVHFMSSVLVLSEPAHSAAITFIPWVVEHTRGWPGSIRDEIIRDSLNLLSVGDKVGGTILKFYTDLARTIYLKK